MSTRSRIGIIRTKYHGEPATVESVYCHSDGYPEHVGALLAEHYTEAAKLDELLTLGDVSCLGAEIGEAHDFHTHRGSDTCLLYGRDRGEEGVESCTHPYGDWPDSGQEYEYLLTATGWVYRESAYGKLSGDPWHVLDREKVAS